MPGDIKNIIFDLGGVIINIDVSAVMRELEKMGHDQAMELNHYLIRNDVFIRLETGELSPDEFRNIIRKQLGKPLTDHEIDRAWNTIIGDIPPERIRLLESVRKNYRTFLLSNTNLIHFNHYNDYIRSSYGYDRLEDLFDKAYFSFQLGMYKPDPKIFEHVIKDAGLLPHDTLFIDDAKINTDSASESGIMGFYLHDGISVSDLFDVNGMLK